MRVHALTGHVWLAMLTALLGALLTTALSARAQEQACGLDNPCSVRGGEYYLAFPPGWDGTTALPAVLYFHSHRSSGASGIKSQTLAAAFSNHGYLIIAPNGEMRPSGVRGWPARPASRGRRDDIAFVRAVMDDVSSRWPIDRKRVLVTGFSSGGSMAWLVACYMGEEFAAYVPVAGALRRPVPSSTCPGGPVPMLHFHGFADTTVPLEGRGIREWHQGDIFESLSILRATNRCRSNPNEISSGEPYSCRSWRDCGSGRDVEFCLHPGGHMLPKGWADRARVWFEAIAGKS